MSNYEKNTHFVVCVPVCVDTKTYKVNLGYGPNLWAEAVEKKFLDVIKNYRVVFSFFWVCHGLSPSYVL